MTRQSTLARRIAEREGKDAIRYVRLATNRIMVDDLSIQLPEAGVMGDLAYQSARRAWTAGQRYVDLLDHETSLGMRQRRRR